MFLVRRLAVVVLAFGLTVTLSGCSIWQLGQLIPGSGQASTVPSPAQASPLPVPDETLGPPTTDATVAPPSTSTTEPSPEPSDPAPEALSWGAIAMSKSNLALGWSYDAFTKSQAKSTALKYCKKYARGTKCTVVFTFHDQCAAFANTKDLRRWAAASRNTKSAAVAAVKAKLGRTADVRTSFCSKA